MRGEEYDVARAQVLSYLSGRVGSSLGRGLERATGLSEVRVEPTLIANEADPGARLTVGQDVTDGLRLIYSTDLADSSNQIWVAEYDVTRRFETRAVRQRDNTYRAEVRHDVRFGGAPEPRRMPRLRPVVTAVSSVSTKAETSHACAAVHAGAGRRLRLLRRARGIEQVEEALRDRGYLQSRARISRTPAAAADGPKRRGGRRRDARPVVRLLFDGVVPPSDLSGTSPGAGSAASSTVSARTTPPTPSGRG
jgi:hypothetical protein